MNKELLLCEVEWAPAAVVTGAPGSSGGTVGEGESAGEGGSTHDDSAGVGVGVGDLADSYRALMATPSCLSSLRVRTFLTGAWGAGKEHGLHSL